MSTIIQSAAYFTMETERSGRIIFANKRDVTCDVFSKQEAREALRIAVEKNLVDKAEVSIIHQQIDHSPLPDHLSQEMEELLCLRELYEDISRRIDRLTISLTQNHESSGGAVSFGPRVIH